MGEFSLMHWLVFGLILMLLFGPSRLPQLGQSLGQAIRGFKKSMNEGLEDPPKAPNTPNQQLSFDHSQNESQRVDSKNSHNS
jgi:TatA/E family protein of Tat protein translocase